MPAFLTETILAYSNLKRRPTYQYVLKHFDNKLHISNKNNIMLYLFVCML